MTGGYGTLDVQVAWSASPLDASPTWTSIPTADLMGVTITRGRAPNAPFYEQGTLTVTLDDTAGNYNVINTGGAHAGALTAYRQIRVLVTDSSAASCCLFRGHVIPRGWKNTPRLPGTATTTVTAADVFQLAALADLSPVDPPTDDGDTLSTRGARVILNVDNGGGTFLSWYRFLAPTGTSGAVMGPSAYGTKLLTYLQQLALSDGGEVWCDKNGLIVLEQGLDVFYDTDRTVVQQTFADSGSGIRFVDITPDYALDIINKARTAGTSGNVQEVSDGSIATISGLASVVEHLDLYTRDDPEVHARGERIVAEHAADYPGPVAITFDAATSTAGLDAAAHLELRQRVQTKYTPPNLAQFTNDHFVEQIVHDIPIEQSPDTWKVTLGLSPAARLATIAGEAPFLTLDDTTFGKLDTAHLAW